MKNVLQKIRQLKSLTDRQTSIILTLTGQCEQQKSESDEKDALIMELLRNCNGIRPALVKGDQQPEKIGRLALHTNSISCNSRLRCQQR